MRLRALAVAFALPLIAVTAAPAAPVAGPPPLAALEADIDRARREFDIPGVDRKSVV